MIFESPHFVLELQPHVLKSLRKYRQSWIGKTEACGVLVGEYDPDRGHYTIVKITTPMLRDIRRRTSFQILDRKHQKIVDQEWRRSSGKRFYLGFWHTHPEASPTPSTVDLKSWKENYDLNEGHTPSLFYPIIGLNEISIWEVSKCGIKKMNCVSDQSKDD